MHLDSNIVNAILSAVVTGFGALFTYLVRSYFKSLRGSIKVLGHEIAKIEGKMDLLGNEVRVNSKEVHGLTAELRAVWRFIDNANKRPSDNEWRGQ